MTEWQLIETAPKDEKSCILWDGRDAFEGFWDAGCWCLTGNEVRAVPPPTHWMPMPKGPK